MMDKIGCLEGLLFIVGDEGLSLEEICNILIVTVEEAKELLSMLNKEYEKDIHGLKISFLGEKFKLTTKKEHASYYKKLATEKENVLSQAQLEVLAIIAYNEPITRVQIDEIRGVNSSYALRKLLVRGLVTECGKADVAGHPNLYKTTDRFLDYFGLKSKNDLIPVNKEFEIIEDVDLFDTKYKENV